MLLQLFLFKMCIFHVSIPQPELSCLE